MGRPRTTAAADDGNDLTAEREEPKTIVHGISNNLQRAGMKVSQAFKAFWSKVHTTPEDANHSGRLEFEELYKDEPKNFRDKVLWMMRQSLTFAEVERSNSGERSVHHPKHFPSLEVVTSWPGLLLRQTPLCLVMMWDKMDSEVYRNILKANLKTYFRRVVWVAVCCWAVIFIFHDAWLSLALNISNVWALF